MEEPRDQGLSPNMYPEQFVSKWQGQSFPGAALQKARDPGQWGGKGGMPETLLHLYQY